MFIAPNDQEDDDPKPSGETTLMAEWIQELLDADIRITPKRFRVWLTLRATGAMFDFV